MSARFEEMLSGPVGGGNVTRGHRVDRPRFTVSELEGYPIRSSAASSRRSLLSCSVLDTACGYLEVARFNEEDVRPRACRSLTRAEWRESLRNRAAGLAAILNAEHADP